MNLVKNMFAIIIAIIIISPVYVYSTDTQPEPEPTNQATINIEILQQLTCTIDPNDNSGYGSTELIIIQGTERAEDEFEGGHIYPAYTLRTLGSFNQEITINFNANCDGSGDMKYCDPTNQVKATVNWYRAMIPDEFNKIPGNIWETGLYGTQSDPNTGILVAYMFIKKIEAAEGTPPGNYTIPFTVSVYYTGF